MARRCVFCGSTGVTREHVIPRWLSNVLPEQALDVLRDGPLLGVGKSLELRGDILIDARADHDQFLGSFHARRSYGEFT